MPSVRTNFSVGLFVILGMTMVIVFVLWLGMSQYLKDGRHYVAFFDESVQGLKKDSPVKYRGVSIGRVESIEVAEDGKLIRILFNLDEPLHDRDKMVAQIKSIGITGIMFVELERMKNDDGFKTPKISFETKHPVVATKASNMKQLLTDISDIIDRIKQIDLKGIENRLIKTLDNVNQTLKDAEVRKVSENLQKTLISGQALMATQKWDPIISNVHQASTDLNLLLKNSIAIVGTIDGSLEQHNQSLDRALKEFNNAAKNADRLLANGNLLVNDTQTGISNIDRELMKTLKSLDTASRNMNSLIQRITDQPSILLFSAPPQPKQIETP